MLALRSLFAASAAAVLLAACSSDKKAAPSGADAQLGGAKGGASGNTSAAGGAAGDSSTAAGSAGDTSAGGRAGEPGGTTSTGGATGVAAGAAGVSGGAGAAAGGSPPGWNAECPTGLPGPRLVKLPRPDGGNYCIDDREVTQGQYHAFALAQAENEKKDIVAACGKNPCASLVEPRLPGGTCKSDACSSCDDLYDTKNPDAYTPEKTPNAPVGLLQQCQQAAYCAWAGKSLCGDFDGKPLSPETWPEPATNMLKWACSNGGTTKYTTGDVRPGPDTCTFASPTNAPPLPNLAVSEGSACHGVGKGFDEVYNLTAGATERAYSLPGAYPEGYFIPYRDRDDCRGLESSPSLTSGFRCCLRLP